MLDLPNAWRNAFERVYNRLPSCPVKILLATYFGDLGENTSLACRLPVAGLHVDLVRAPEQLTAVLDNFANRIVLSLGLIDGRNVWRADLHTALDTVAKARERFKGELWLAPSCSLLHVPIDLERETALDPSIKSWLAFARQKPNIAGNWNRRSNCASGNRKRWGSTCWCTAKRSATTWWNISANG